jgi:hypothetical protein
MNFIPNRSTSLMIFAGAIVVATAALPSCNRSPAVSSPESQRLIQRFYTACNTRNSERLEAAIQTYEQLIAQSKVGQAESEIFDRIINLARNDQWEQATETGLRFAEGQVNRW